MKILLIEDHKMLATSLKDSIRNEENIQVDILDDMNNINTIIRFGDYDLVIVDINLNGLTNKQHGLELSQRLIEEFKNIKILILTGYNLKYYQGVAKQIGCYGFISKEEDTKSLIKKIKLIVNDDEKVFPKYKQKIEELTTSEIEIVKFYSSGMTRNEVAAKTYMSLRSLAVSLNRIYKKLDVKNYQELTDKAREIGYIDSF